METIDGFKVGEVQAAGYAMGGFVYNDVLMRPEITKNGVTVYMYVSWMRYWLKSFKRGRHPLSEFNKKDLKDIDEQTRKRSIIDLFVKGIRIER